MKNEGSNIREDNQQSDSMIIKILFNDEEKLENISQKDTQINAITESDNNQKLPQSVKDLLGKVLKIKNDLPKMAELYRKSSEKVKEQEITIQNMQLMIAKINKQSGIFHYQLGKVEEQNFLLRQKLQQAQKQKSFLKEQLAAKIKQNNELEAEKNCLNLQKNSLQMDKIILTKNLKVTQSQNTENRHRMDELLEENLNLLVFIKHHGLENELRTFQLEETRNTLNNTTHE